MLFKPQWYMMLPDDVKPIDENVIKKIEDFRKKYGAPDKMIFMGIMVSKWAVKRIQKYILKLIRKQIPNASEKELWKVVLLARLDTKLMSPPETDTFAKPLSREEIVSREENIDNIVSDFESFDDVIDYIIQMDEEENRFYDPIGMQSELENLLET